MLYFLWIALTGFAAGLIARALHPGKDNLGFIMTAVLGVASAFGATFLVRLSVGISKVKMRDLSCR